MTFTGPVAAIKISERAFTKGSEGCFLGIKIKYKKTKEGDWDSMEAIFNMINNVFSFVTPLSDFLWDFPTNFEWYKSIPVLGNFSFAIILLLGSGLFFSFKLGFMQVPAVYLKQQSIIRQMTVHHLHPKLSEEMTVFTGMNVQRIK